MPRSLGHLHHRSTVRHQGPGHVAPRIRGCQAAQLRCCAYASTGDRSSSLNVSADPVLPSTAICSKQSRDGIVTWSVLCTLSDCLTAFPPRFPRSGRGFTQSLPQILGKQRVMRKIGTRVLISGRARRFRTGTDSRETFQKLHSFHCFHFVFRGGAGPPRSHHAQPCDLPAAVPGQGTRPEMPRYRKLALWSFWQLPGSNGFSDSPEK